MGQLKPGATYIYERSNGAVYAREKGQQERILIGKMYDGNGLDINETALWNDIRKEALTNPTLQKALDHAIMIYRLSKDKPL